MINKIKELAVKFFNKVYGASNKKILLWGVGFSLLPFIFTGIQFLLIEFSYLIASFAIKVALWISTVKIFSFSANATLLEHARFVSWPIDRIVDAMSSPFADYAMIAIACLLPILGAMVLVKTKGQNLSALFVTSMSLVLIYALIFVG